MGRGRGGSGRGRGSGRIRSSGIDIGSYAGSRQHANSIKDKAKIGIFKALGNAMFTYGEKNSADEI